MLVEQLSRNELFTDSEQILADYILENPQEVLNMTMRELAQKNFISAPTVVRLCKKLGFDSFSAFKMQLHKEIDNEYLKMLKVDYDFPFKKGQTPEEIVNVLSSLAMAEIINCRDSFDYQTVTKVARLISRADAIDIYGIGHSLNSAKAFYEKMSHIGFNISLIDGQSFQVSRAVHASKKGLAILVSYSGQTKQILKIAQILKENGVRIIAITGNPNGQLMRYANDKIMIHSYEKYAQFEKTDNFGSLYFLHFLFDCLFAIIFNLNYEDNLQKELKLALWQKQSQES